MKRRTFLVTSLLALPAGRFIAAETPRPNLPVQVGFGKDRADEAISYRGNQFFLKLAGKDTAGDLCIFDTVRVRTGGPRLHLHHSQDESTAETQPQFQPALLRA
jgi:hypothetical protein